jgi:5,10-methylenetetrahydromethanopterin reductase
MDLGIGMPTAADSWRTAKRAEDAGCATAWFYDTQLLNADLFAAMAVGAVKTDKIRLAAGVLIPSNRIAPVAANGFATLNALAPGRIHAGVGTGFTGRRTMGLPAYKLSDMGEYIRIMQAMWRGETPEIAVEGKTRKVRFLNPDLKLVNIDDPIPVHLSAMGPKSRKLTAALDADWINIGFDEAVVEATAKDMDAAYKGAGIDPKAKRKSLFVVGSVLKDGEAYDSPRVKKECGPMAVISLHDAMEAPLYGSLAGGDADAPDPDSPFARMVRDYAQIYESYAPADARYLTLHRGHMMFVRPEEERFVTDDLIRLLTLTGPAAAIRDRLRRFRDFGYDEVVVQVAPGCESMIEDWARVMETV